MEKSYKLPESVRTRLAHLLSGSLIGVPFGQGAAVFRDLMELEEIIEPEPPQEEKKEATDAVS